VKLIGRVLLATLAFGSGMILTGILAPILRLPAWPSMDVQPPSPETWLLIMLATTPLFMASLLPLVLGLRGSWVKRWFAVGVLLFVAHGLNNLIELTIFSTHGSDALYGVPYFVLPCFFAAAVLTAGRSDGAEATLERFRAADWSWRIALAWLSFPVIYFVFGTAVAPIVVPYYEAGIANLIIPPIDIIIRTLFLRSFLFLAASFPAIVLWRKSRGQFIVAMGLAHAMAVGIYPLAQAGANFMPTVVRVSHAIEITADSFAYAAALGLLLLVGKKRAELAVAS
jgi:hypothetical protein